MLWVITGYLFVVAARQETLCFQKLSFQTCLQHLQKSRCHGFKGGAWSGHTCSVGSLGMKEGSPWKGEHIGKGLVGGAAVCCTHEERRWMSLREEKQTCWQPEEKKTIFFLFLVVSFFLSQETKTCTPSVLWGQSTQDHLHDNPPIKGYKEHQSRALHQPIFEDCWGFEQ